MSTSIDQDLADNYQKKTQLEHIKDAPDTYIGSVEKDTIENWILDDEKMKFKSFEWIPGLYKCFDEAIVNCAATMPKTTRAPMITHSTVSRPLWSLMSLFSKAIVYSLH